MDGRNILIVTGDDSWCRSLQLAIGLARDESDCELGILNFLTADSLAETRAILRNHKVSAVVMVIDRPEAVELATTLGAQTCVLGSSLTCVVMVRASWVKPGELPAPAQDTFGERQLDGIAEVVIRNLEFEERHHSKMPNARDSE